MIFYFNVDIWHLVFKEVRVDCSKNSFEKNRADHLIAYADEHQRGINEARERVETRELQKGFFFTQY